MLRSFDKDIIKGRGELRKFSLILKEIYIVYILNLEWKRCGNEVNDWIRFEIILFYNI